MLRVDLVLVLAQLMQQEVEDWISLVLFSSPPPFPLLHTNLNVNL